MCLGMWLLVCLIIFLVEAKEWGNRMVGCRREVVKVEELKKNREKTKQKTEEYQDKLKDTYHGVREREKLRVRGRMGVNERKFCGACKRCVWKDVCWSLYEEGQ